MYTNINIDTITKSEIKSTLWQKIYKIRMHSTVHRVYDNTNMA